MAARTARTRVEVEPVAAAELQLQAPEAARRGGLGAPRHVVGVAEPDRPGGRRPAAAQAEQPAKPGRPASFPCRSWSAASSAARAACSPGGSAAAISSSAHGSSPSSTVVEPGERGGGGLVVALDRRRLAEARDAVVAHLDLDHLGLVLRPREM